MRRNMTVYQARLRELVTQCCSGENKKPLSFRGLAVKMGDPSLRARLSRWFRDDLKQPVHYSAFVQLAKVDPQGRSAEQLFNWVNDNEVTAA